MKTMMRFVFKLFILIILAVFFCTESAIAAVSQINGVRMWASPESTRLVIDLSHSAGHRLSSLSNPERVVIDIDKAKLTRSITGLNYKSGAISDIRSANKKHNKVRLVLDLKHKIHPNVRCIIIPGTQNIYLQALKEGLLEIFIDAGAILSTPTCGPCLGGHMGILAAGEKAISTTNRNFTGRMGHIESEVYLSSPAIAAASAIKGYITSPEYI